MEIQYDPAKEFPKRRGNRIFVVNGTNYLLTPGVNEIPDEAITVLQSDPLWKSLLEQEALKLPTVPVATVLGMAKQTVAERVAALEQTFATEGYRPIETAAAAVGITNKPTEGWKSAIPAIAQAELQRGLIVS
jgi:hypothetical protein